jgi:DNA-binding NarL/FixJ family response regulator
MRILIADDSEVMRRAVRGLLSSEPDWEICGEASDGPGALEKARALQPHVVLLDINMPGTTGLQTARRIRQEVPPTKILIMTLQDAACFLPTVRAAGADGCVDKARLGNDLIDAIKKLVEPGAGEPHSVDN